MPPLGILSLTAACLGRLCRPQVGRGFNRDYWARLEAFVRRVARAEGVKAVYCLTGPLWLPEVLKDGKLQTAYQVPKLACDGSSSSLEPSPASLTHPLTWFFAAVAVAVAVHW